MAARYQLGCAKLFKFSRTLFTKEDGAPYTFYFADKLEDLDQILNKGLGELVDSPDKADFVLTENKQDGNGYLPLNFIVDCVKRNAFLDPNKYSQHGHKSTVNQPSTSKAAQQNCEDSDEEFFLKSSTIEVNRSALQGRSKYTDTEDLKIIRYLIVSKRHKETGGNVVWKHMEAKKVTDHTYQSMKARFAKKILPDIDSYDIPQSWKRMLTGQTAETQALRFSPAKKSRRSESPEIDLTFESLEAWKKKESAPGKKLVAVSLDSSDGQNQPESKDTPEPNVVVGGRESDQRRSLNFPLDDNDLNSQELDELDLLILQEVNNNSRVDPQLQERQRPPEQPPTKDCSSPKPSTSKPRSPQGSESRPTHSSSPAQASLDRNSNSPRVRKDKKSLETQSTQGSSPAQVSSDRNSSLSQALSNRNSNTPPVRKAKESSDAQPTHRSSPAHPFSVRESSPGQETLHSKSNSSLPKQAKKSSETQPTHNSSPAQSFSDRESSPFRALSHSKSNATPVKRGKKFPDMQPKHGSSHVQSFSDSNSNTSPVKRARKSLEMQSNHNSGHAQSFSDRESSPSHASPDRKSNTSPVKRSKKSSVLCSSSDEESSISGTFSPPKLSKFLQSQTDVGDDDGEREATPVAPVAGTSRGEADGFNNFDITQRRVSVINQMYGLSKEQAVQLLLQLDGDFSAALLYLEKAV